MGSREIGSKFNIIRLPLKMINNIMNKKMDNEKALEYIRIKHEGQFREGVDKNGNKIPFSKHPEKVAKILEEKGFGQEYILAGLFHDLLEETNATGREIIKLSNRKVYIAVCRLTKPPKPKNYEVDEAVQKKYMKRYIKGIRNNDIAHIVKLADRIHNLKESFMQDEVFIKKYIKETEEYFIDLARGTVFEEDLNTRLNALKEFYNDKYFIKS